MSYTKYALSQITQNSNDYNIDTRIIEKTK